MMNVNRGEIVIVHSNNVSALLIQFGMNLMRWMNPMTWYRLVKGVSKHKIWRTIFNHDGMGRDTDMVQEAVSKGTVTHNLDAAYSGRNNITIRVYRYEWSEEQLDAMEKIAVRMEGKKYQFDNFIQWAVYILTFGTVWFGKSGSKALNKIYCSELNAMKMYYATAPNLSRNDTDDEIHQMFMRYWRVNPKQVQDFCEKYCKLVNEYKFYGKK